jgi:hypothetical protein
MAEKSVENTEFASAEKKHNVSVRYSRKRFSRLFPAVAPLSHEVHSFTRIVQQTLDSTDFGFNGQSFAVSFLVDRWW